MRNRVGFTLVELLVVISIIGVLIALLLPAVQAARESARRAQCSNQLRQVAIAILHHEDARGLFPVSFPHYQEAGVDGTGESWMVGILPYIEQTTAFGQLDTTGRADSGRGMVGRSNRQIIATPIDVYFCPSDTTKGELRTDVWLLPNVPFATTNYAGVLGPHDLGNSSLFGGLPDCHNYSTTRQESCSGAFWRHSHLAPVTLASFLDGLSNTMIVGEVLPEFDSFKYWALGNGTWASTHAPLNWFPEPNEPWSGWFNQISFRSRHPGGGHFAWGDGHVSLVSESINVNAYRAASTRSGEDLTGTLQ